MRPKLHGSTMLALLIPVFLLVCDGAVSQRARILLYEDLSLVTFPVELETLTAKSGKEKEEWLRAFWKKRDMVLVSAGTAREAEHYRRVWYTWPFSFPSSATGSDASNPRCNLRTVRPPPARPNLEGLRQGR